MRRWLQPAPRAGLAIALVASMTGGARAQDTLPPHLGGYVRSLGLPSVHHPYAALAVGFDRFEERHAGVQLRLGLSDPVGNAALGLLSLNAELYGGVRDGNIGGGLRGLALSPLLSTGIGLDLDFRTGRTDPFLTVLWNVRRGGLAGRGTHLRFEWYPTRSGSFGAAFVVPIDNRLRGRTRPRRDHVILDASPPRPIHYSPSPALAESLRRIEGSGYWINQLTVVPLFRSRGPPDDVAARELAPLRARLDGTTASSEFAAYHYEIERAFSIAVSDEEDPTGVTPLGSRVAAKAREILLERVLFPYNRLLGQQKRDDTTLEFAVHARGILAHWLVRDSVIPTGKLDAALLVFQSMLDVAEAARASNRASFGDSRLVWLPLQLALRSIDYVRKEDLDTLISHAVGRRILHGNRMWYIYNSRFHQQLVRSIAEAEEYHVLWIHDFRGVNAEGIPDTLSLQLVTRAYFDALTKRVEAYDGTGHIPAYMLFLDQLYFELNRSREVLELLQSPMQPHRLQGLPTGLADTIAAWQSALRDAVDASRLLAIERAEYGEQWLDRLVRVHVSVTNPADPSYRSTQGISIVGIPDDIMRDHRKAVAYDLSEEDPYRGMAMYAGMGVGEHYASAAWEDRALMLQGPAALSLRDAARRLLETQGIPPGQIPHVLRPRPRARDYDERVRLEIDSMDARGEVAVRAVELHNATGFGPKEISVAQATLFNLTSPGAVFKIPDSLWLNELFASLIAGAALRGTRVLPIAPSAASAPAPDWGLAAIHHTFSMLIAFGRTMTPEIERAGGLLRPGIYDAHVGVHDLDARIAALADRLAQHTFLRDLYPGLQAFLDELACADTSAAGTDGFSDGSVEPTSTPTKLHLKGFLYVSGPAWSHLIEGAPLTDALRLYLRERDRLQADHANESDEARMSRLLQRIGAGVINPVLDSLSLAERSEWAFFLQIGSPNLDHRSMLLDGEVAALISGWTSLYAFFDFMLLLGLVDWVNDQQQLDALIPAPGWFRRFYTRFIRFAL
jgi:hypothetical protein